MMTYFALDLKIATDGYFAKSVQLSDETIADEKYEGLPWSREGLSIQLPNTRGRIMDFIGNLYNFLILSENVVEILQSFEPTNLELYPVTLKRKSEKGFYLVNLLNCVDCMDLSSSDYEELAPGTMVLGNINKLVFDRERLGDRHFFRPKYLEDFLFVSEELKNDLEGFEGFRFIPLEDFKLDLSASNLE